MQVSSTFRFVSSVLKTDTPRARLVHKRCFRSAVLIRVDMILYSSRVLSFRLCSLYSTVPGLMHR